MRPATSFGWRPDALGQTSCAPAFGLDGEFGRFNAAIAFATWMRIGCFFELAFSSWIPT